MTILERNPSPLLHDQGAGVVAGGDTQAFFDQYDRTRAQTSCKSNRRIYLSRSGSIVHEEAMLQHMTSWDTLYHVLRANFDGVQSAYCDVPETLASDGKTRYAHDRSVTGFQVRQDNGRIDVRWRNSAGDQGTETADLLIGSDGPSSGVRGQLVPSVQRKLAGYCALRGTVPEMQASEEARAVFVNGFTFFHADGLQILAYLIAGENGNTTPGHRLLNFVWYKNFPVESAEFKDLMTDSHGQVHRYTLPPGSMRPEFWDKMKRYASANMPPQFAELVHKTTSPFAQAVTDVITPTNDFHNGKVLLMGDALAGLRPHTVASTSQAAFDAMQIAAWLSGKQTRAQMMRQMVSFARLIQHRGVQMGNRSQLETGVPLDKHIEDRNRASTPRHKEVYPPWTLVGLPEE